MIAIVDYGLGNVAAFAHIFRQLNVPVKVAQNANELNGAAKIILPGVGAFDHAMQRLLRSGMREALDDIVAAGSVSLLGVCVGMQMLAQSSEEGVLPGLGWIEGRVRKFEMGQSGSPRDLPHMGWNDVALAQPCRLFAGLESDARFYFLHSYYFCAASEASVLAHTDYGIRFSCAVGAGNVYGVQFHPEKSHRCGVRLLKNFADL